MDLPRLETVWHVDGILLVASVAGLTSRDEPMDQLWQAMEEVIVSEKAAGQKGRITTPCT